MSSKDSRGADHKDTDLVAGSLRESDFPKYDDSNLQRTAPARDSPSPSIGAAILVPCARKTRGILTRSELRRAVSSSSTTCPSDNDMEKEVVIDSDIEVCEFEV